MKPTRLSSWLFLSLLALLVTGACEALDEITNPPTPDGIGSLDPDFSVRGFLRVYDDAGGAALGTMRRHVEAQAIVDDQFFFPTVNVPNGSYRVRVYYVATGRGASALVIVYECDLDVTDEGATGCTSGDLEGATLSTPGDAAGYAVSGETFTAFLVDTFPDLPDPCANIFNCNGDGESNLQEAQSGSGTF